MGGRASTWPPREINMRDGLIVQKIGNTLVAIPVQGVKSFTITEAGNKVELWANNTDTVKISLGKFNNATLAHAYLETWWRALISQEDLLTDV